MKAGYYGTLEIKEVSQIIIDSVSQQPNTCSGYYGARIIVKVQG
ncbi:MAG: hypothetical protein ACKVJP_02415 [Flavobacteriales bacterium]